MKFYENADESFRFKLIRSSADSFALIGASGVLVVPALCSLADNFDNCPLFLDIVRHITDKALRAATSSCGLPTPQKFSDRPQKSVSLPSIRFAGRGFRRGMAL
jgi:hypothetical protein